ncbi:hypothetical protein L9F63_002003 [Diploptera punctata]|uniref:WD repeat-containing protein 79 n=1 Tax=Diploptera punctata TaxID=6984 RepID=A0AAD8A2T0_DIPPU|nr:hypothetical protein L9F63_002003 [Diploptera punctata]
MADVINNSDNMCTDELDLRVIEIDNNPVMTSGPETPRTIDVLSSLNRQDAGESESYNYEIGQNTDMNTEIKPSEDNSDLQTQSTILNIGHSENVDTTETDTNKNLESNPDLGKSENFEEKETLQENTDMRISYTSLQYNFENACQITGAWKEFRNKDNMFMKGCKWSPDGTCILTNSEDNVLRVFDLPRELHCQEIWDKDTRLPEMEPALKVQEGGIIYDYSWYPLMTSWNPLSCCFVSTSKDSPIHLWDAFTGKLRCTYRAYNVVDEIESANSLTFSPSGEKLYCGFKNFIRVFNTNYPGRECTIRNLKRQFPTQKQTGIISCISVNPALPNIYAAGSYSRSIGVYSEPHGTLLCLLLGHTGGITHIQFSPDGTKLLSGGRKDSEIICWDIRNPGNILFTVKREVATNQRIYFDITSDSQYFVSGNTNGKVNIWDTSQITEATTPEPVLAPCSVIHAHDDCVNGVSLHQQYPILATTSGQRHVTCLESESDSSSENLHCDTSLKLWWVGKTTT